MLIGSLYTSVRCIGNELICDGSYNSARICHIERYCGICCLMLPHILYIEASIDILSWWCYHYFSDKCDCVQTQNFMVAFYLQKSVKGITIKAHTCKTPKAITCFGTLVFNDRYD